MVIIGACLFGLRDTRSPSAEFWGRVNGASLTCCCLNGLQEDICLCYLPLGGLLIELFRPPLIHQDNR